MALNLPRFVRQCCSSAPIMVRWLLVIAAKIVPSLRPFSAREQPGERPQVLNDISAGAYFRITPTLKVGGSFALGEQDLTPRANAARPAAAPKVRLETAFKF